MKRFLAVILSIFMLSSLVTLPAFAAGEYVKDEDMEGKDFTLAEGSWILTYNAAATDTTALAATEMTNAASNYNVGSKASAAVYKVKLPSVPAGKEIDTAEFRMTSYYSGARAMPYAYKMPGDDWDMSKITIAEAQKLINGNSLGTGAYYLGPCKEDATLYANSTDYRNRYDVGEYINECIKNGQEYAWIAVTRHNTIKAYRHNCSGCEAKLYYTFRDSLGFTVKESDPTDGATGVYAKGTATVTYSDNVASASATINDKEVAADNITISGNTVNIKLDLGLSEEVTLVVNAEDASGNTDLYEVMFTTDSKYRYYDDSDMEGIDYTLADGSWILCYDPAGDVTAPAATQMTTSSANYNVGNKKNAAVYRVALPQIPQGKELEMAEFRMSSYYSTSQARVMPYAYKMTGDDWNMDTITIGDAQKLIDGNNLGTGDNLLATCVYDESYANPADYRNKYTVSDYVAQAIANKQDYVWIAVTYTGTIKAYRHNYENQEAKLYYTLKDVGVLSVEAQEPAEGATGVYSIGKASVSFSNQIACATATINGDAVSSEDIEISGKTVNISFSLGLNAETAITVTATDANAQTVSHTINFTTDSKYKFYDDSDMAGIEYTEGVGSWVLNIDAATEDKTVLAATAMESGTNVNVGGAGGNGLKAAVYKLKLPVVPEGKRVKIAELRVSTWYSSQRFLPYLYKMPGDDWDMSTITVTDATALIDGTKLGSGDHYLTGCSSDASYYDGNSISRCKYDVTKYINECIKNGQEYVYLAATHGYTIKAYAHDAAQNEAKLYFTLEDAPAEELIISQAKIVDVSSDDEYAQSTDAVITANKDVKAIIEMTNTTANDVYLVVAVAQYNGNKLVAVSYVPYTLETETENETIELGAMTIDASATKIKAFIWNTNLSDAAPAKVIDIK